ncbi:MAG: winged helix-turn-helix domain-containing protein [Calothrix sp. SM1_5_4]|nr:winged helix-turn-helix domain-containing protein [Calothrix sp. SM1_5_4]
MVALEQAAEVYAKLRDHKQFIKCLTHCLRMYAEMEDRKSLQAIKDRLYEYVARQGIDLNSTTYYTLALVASYRGEYAQALEHLERALALALAEDSKEDMCYAIHGLAAVYWSLGRTEDSLKEIYNLRVFFQVLKLPDLEISSQILNGYILVSMKRYDEALDVFWKSFESLKNQKNMYTYVSLLFAMGYAYAEAGEVDLSKTYTRLAQQMADSENFVFLLRKINELNKKISGKSEGNFDLIFNSASNSVVERKKGKIDFKNQFILLDMLKLFLRSPGEVYSKEALVKAVWKQEYDPSVHDNKIYVTIKRLRQLIEPDFDKPKYIYRAKNGYYLNRNAKVSIEQ